MSAVEELGNTLGGMLERVPPEQLHQEQAWVTEYALPTLAEIDPGSTSPELAEARALFEHTRELIDDVLALSETTRGHLINYLAELGMHAEQPPPSPPHPSTLPRVPTDTAGDRPWTGRVRTRRVTSHRNTWRGNTMTTIDTGTVITGILGHEFHYARTLEETADLVETVLDTRYSQIYVWDRPCLSFRDENGPSFPHARLRITVAPDDGWGALNHMDARPEAVNGEAVDSHNPHVTEDTPALLFDPEGQLFFPASASLPLDRAREVIAEYCRTGQRPTCVAWQPGQWY